MAASESTSTPPARPPLAMVLIGIGATLREQLDDRLSTHGITMRHYGALGHLANSPELSTSDLARRARVTPQSMRATVEHLEEIGAVEHRRHGQGKASQLVVTASGRRLLERARTLVAELDSDVLGDVANRDDMRDVLLTTMFELRQPPRSNDLP